MKPRDDKKSFYEFDDVNNEIVFYRHDMPTPWMNYLTNGEFFTMISHAGGNLSWYKSSEIWRIGRYGFYNIPTDKQGLFIYIKDLSTGKVWNPNVIPVDTELDYFESRHGLGYSRYIGEKDGVRVRVTAFVGKDNALIYKVSVISNADRKIQIFTAKEMGNMEYLRETQWQCYTKQSNDIYYNKREDALIYNYFIDFQPRPEETPDVFMTSTLPSSSFSGVRKHFLGAYRDLSNPLSIEQGKCSNTELKGGEGIFAFSYDLSLSKNKEEVFAITLGTINQDEKQDEVIHKFKSMEYINSLEEGLKEKWAIRRSRFNVKTNDPDLDRMANVWNPYQAYINFLVCRGISFYATGCIRGFGVRDTSQDCMSAVLNDSKLVIERIKEVMTEQFKEGKTTHYYYHLEKRESLISDRSDDHLWMIYAVHELIMENGDTSFLNDVVPYYDGGSGTILEHLKASIEFTKNHMGQHNIPLMLNSDWNDCLNTVCRKGKGESVMAAEQYVLACHMMAEILTILGEDGSYYEELAKEQTRVLNENMFDDDHYIRAFTDSGVCIGGKDEECARYWINSNSWAILSGVADEERGNKILDAILKNNLTDYGLVIQYPTLHRNYPSQEEEISFATPGIGENGGIFCHANTWAIMAYAMMNRADDAYKIYSNIMPDHIVDKIGVDAYCTEPYVYSSNVRAPYVDRGGEAAVSWLTGTATWMNIAVSQYIFGIKPTYNGLSINPKLPSHIKEADIVRIYRGTKYIIHVINKGHKNKYPSLFIDGEKQDGHIISSKDKQVTITCMCE